MKVSLSWLKDYVDIDVSAEELQKKLFSCGFEVEELIEIGKDISGVVVGEVVSCEPVEGTHLHLCEVDCGAHGVLQICCGADNVEKGIKAPCALVGATVYATAKDHVTIEGVMTIKKGKLRGIDSFGMLCSGAEIGVNGDMYEGGDYCGLLLLPKSAKNGEDVKPLLGLDDYIFDIGVTANRPDCQSVFGIAREVAAVLKKPVKEPDYSFTPKKGKYEGVKITVDAPDLCPRYIGHFVDKVKIAPSPMWLKKRLASCGLRSINNVVDITNFVLLELGQPMHAFDIRTLSGREINVRRAKNGEKLTTLDEKEFTLTNQNLVICDKDKPCALAGVMGGLNSEIKDDTTAVLFESAKFARDNIRRTARALGQHSDSSALFEKGVNEYTTERAMRRALHLIEELDCGVVTDVHVDVVTKNSHSAGKKMVVKPSKINALLGIEVSAADMKSILENLNFGVKIDGDSMELDVPAYREDVDDYPDVAEEIIRFYGYDNIEGTFLPSAKITNGGYNETQRKILSLKDRLAAIGLYETTSYSFYSPKDLDMLHLEEGNERRRAIKVLNPISEELSIMRTTLAPSIVNVAVRNLKRGNMAGRIYEVANVYIPNELPIKTFPIERKTLAIGMWGAGDFFDLKGIVESVADLYNLKFEYDTGAQPFLHPGIAAKILLGEKEIGYLGLLSPVVSEELAIDRAVYVAELDFEAVLAAANPFKYQPLSKFATVTRDLALECDRDLTCAQIEKEIFAACKYVTDARLFDIYMGEQVGAGKKSMAFKLTFTPKDEPIEDKIDGFVKKILNNLKFKLGITQR